LLEHPVWIDSFKKMCGKNAKDQLKEGRTNHHCIH
jgi:hypothetical protein